MKGINPHTVLLNAIDQLDLGDEPTTTTSHPTCKCGHCWYGEFVFGYYWRDRDGMVDECTECGQILDNAVGKEWLRQLVVQEKK